MNIRKEILYISLLLFWIATIRVNQAVAQSTYHLENDLYRITVLRNGDIEVSPKDVSASFHFSPTFMIMSRKDDPGIRYSRVRSLAFVVPGWKTLQGEKITSDFFNIADTVTLQAAHTEVEGNSIVWTFKSSKDFILRASLFLPGGKEDPQIKFRLQAKEPGWYSVGYTGAPQTPPNQINRIWQPLIWQEKRFPYQSFLSMEFMCTIPATLVNTRNYTLGVVADPSEIPFRFTTIKNSRFGVLLRNPAGNAQPMLFAPIMGQAASQLQAGDTASFRLRLVVRKEPLFKTYEYIAQHIMGFHDYRKNATCSLNETIQNMISYAMNDTYSGWETEYKAPDYSTDVSGTVKLVSALHPLSIAMITDNKQVYSRRALPMIEYLMSREKYLFAINAKHSKHQSPSHYLKGPAAKVSELAALYNMSGKKSPVFSYYAQKMYGKPRVLNLKMISKGKSWQSALALYRMNGDTAYLNKAKRGADEYIARRIDTPQTDFSDVHIKNGGQFWTDFAPKWIDLLELYETTKDKHYLDAAAKGAQLFVQYIWMEPAPPDKEITINKRGEVGMYAHQNRNNPRAQPMKAPEQKVPAWRVSQTGLISEASTTYVGNRAVFLAHYAAFLLRLAYYTGDTFFRDIARAAIVGRYANFPGYSIMGEYTTIYGRPDYPLRSLNEITYNNIYYNHVWPQIALLMDFLVTDASTLSKGNIHFPHQYAQGYAYLQSDVYGGSPGTFYGDKNVQLWMPAKMLRTDNIQANYIAGYGNGNLYIALTNQSPKPIQVNLQLNANIVPFDEQKSYKVRVWKNNHFAGNIKMKDGKISLSIDGHNITAISIEDLAITPQLGKKINTPRSSLSGQSYTTQETELGKTTGVIIQMNNIRPTAYIWLQATEKELKEAHLRYLQKGKWKEAIDKIYPYEFSIPLTDKATSFEYWLEGITANDSVVNSEKIKLKIK